MMLAWVDGRVLPAGKATVPLLDRAHLLGDGVFETMLARGCRIRRLDLHEQRLQDGLEAMRMPSTDIRAAASDLANATREWAEAAIRIQVSTGDWQDLAGADGGSRVTGLARPIPSSAPPVLTVHDAPIASSVAKATGYGVRLAALRGARADGFDDVVFCNDARRLIEATTANIMAIVGDDLFAPGPAEGALDGITRRLVLQCAGEVGLRVHDMLEIDKAREADALLLTSTLRGIQPAASLLGRAIPGSPWTARLQAAYAALSWEAP